MSPVTDEPEAWSYLEEIRAAVRTVRKVFTYDDPGAEFRLPAVLVYAPELTLAIGAAATDAQYPVVVMADGGKDVLKRLLSLVDQVAAAIHDHTDGSVVVTTASPGNWEAGGQVLPCYLLTVEVSL